MQRARVYLKAFLFLSVTIVLSPFYFFVLIFFFKWREIIGPRLVQFYSGICLSIFRVRIGKVKNYRTFKKRSRGFLIISNHSSFLDIFVLSSLFRTVFVSKAEVKYYPIIGQIAWLMGVVFLDRSSSRQRLKVLRKIAAAYSGRIIAVFPQGTTGRITDRLPFSRGIFKVAELNPDIALLPVTIHYRKDAEIAWHKPQTFRENAAAVAALERIDVEVTVHAPLTIDGYRGKTAAQICETMEQTVLEPLQKRRREA